MIKREVIYAEDVEKIFGKRPWVSRSQEIIEENERAAEPSLDDMPDEVKQAQAEHERTLAESKNESANDNNQ